MNHTEYERNLIAIKKWNERRAKIEADGIAKFWRLKAEFLKQRNKQKSA